MSTAPNFPLRKNEFYATRIDLAHRKGDPRIWPPGELVVLASTYNALLQEHEALKASLAGSSVADTNTSVERPHVVMPASGTTPSTHDRSQLGDGPGSSRLPVGQLVKKLHEIEAIRSDAIKVRANYPDKQFTNVYVYRDYVSGMRETYVVEPSERVLIALGGDYISTDTRRWAEVVSPPIEWIVSSPGWDDQGRLILLRAKDGSEVIGELALEDVMVDEDEEEWPIWKVILENGDEVALSDYSSWALR